MPKGTTLTTVFISTTSAKPRTLPQCNRDVGIIQLLGAFFLIGGFPPDNAAQGYVLGPSFELAIATAYETNAKVTVDEEQSGTKKGISLPRILS